MTLITFNLNLLLLKTLNTGGYRRLPQNMIKVTKLIRIDIVECWSQPLFLTHPLCTSSHESNSIITTSIHLSSSLSVRKQNCSNILILNSSLLHRHLQHHPSSFNFATFKLFSLFCLHLETEKKCSSAALVLINFGNSNQLFFNNFLERVYTDTS